MARSTRLMPTDPQLFTASVLRSERLSPSFQRVTIAGSELAGFDWQGLDHWFRLFLPRPGQSRLRLPKVSGRAWFRSYVLLPGSERPHYSNYTVADFRRTDGGGELDIDVVLHWHDGEPGGAVAAWAVSAETGAPVALLDQGVMFDPPSDAGDYLFACDESGLPAVRGILRDLPVSATGTALIEVPSAADVPELTPPAGVDVQWLPRGDAGDVPGRLALAALEKVVPRPDAYAFVVGESGLATGGRRALRKAGLPTARIDFTGFWKA